MYQKEKEKERERKGERKRDSVYKIGLSFYRKFTGKMVSVNFDKNKVKSALK